MKLYLQLFLSTLLFGCTSEIKETPDVIPDTIVVDDTPKQYVPTEELIRNYVYKSLEISDDEKITIETFEADCNGDDSLDIVITVNLLDRALKEAIKSNSIAKRAELGYMGRFNYMIYMDGASRSLSKAIAIPSSPHGKLAVSFENIRTEHYKDILIDFRIRNSGFREFYSVVNEIPRRVLQVKLFDGLGDSTYEGYTIGYKPGRYSLAKDVIVYKGTFDNPTFDDPLGSYQFTPEITATQEIDRQWFFNDGQFKYFTDK
ncbi:MAG: hypothetical protein MK066_14515 [Crocinitomicaceae bacterium]|nr:hypothetical protein [Crocinitomicaceae bacterium]